MKLKSTAGLFITVLLSLNSVYPQNTHISSDYSMKDTLNKQRELKFKMSKSPLKAILLSALIPGAGQFYNESYWKIPVIAGLTGYFGYEYFRNNRLYKENRDLYLQSQTIENPSGNPVYKSLREFYRNQRDDFMWYFLVVYFLNLVDAYVDAHLFDFDVKDENISGSPNYKFNFSIKF